jgi:hypothetical protein
MLADQEARSQSMSAAGVIYALSREFISPAQGSNRLQLRLHFMGFGFVHIDLASI